MRFDFLFFFFFLTFFRVWPQGTHFWNFFDFFPGSHKLQCFGSFFTFLFRVDQTGGLFWNFFLLFFQANSTRGTVFGLFSLKNYGATSQGLPLDIFWSIFGLGTLEGPLWSRAHFKDLFGLSLKHLCHKEMLRDLLNPKHLSMLK